MSDSSLQRRTLTYVAALYVVWVLLTWFLEGRILTLMRPDAAVDRVVYVVVANLLIGIVVAAWLVGRFLRYGVTTRRRLGSRRPVRAVLAASLGLGAGLFLYVVQGPPTMDPVVVLNGYAQVFAVSAAEVVVCWVVVGGAVEAVARGRGRFVGPVAGAVAASVLFGVYHFAHSPPFNTVSMVTLLTLVGLVTSLFYFGVRDIYGTVLFHNFLGTFGVLGALEASGNLNSFTELQPALLGTAAVAALLLVASDHLFLRRAETGSVKEPQGR